MAAELLTEEPTHTCPDCERREAMRRASPVKLLLCEVCHEPTPFPESEWAGTRPPRCPIHDALTVETPTGRVLVCDETCGIALAPQETGAWFEHVRVADEAVLRAGPATYCAVCGVQITEGRVAA